MNDPIESNEGAGAGERGSRAGCRLASPALPAGESPVKKAARKRAAAVGFTLLELLVVIAVIAALVAAITVLLTGER